jgi:membrane protein implicated in regulation of membrane protease activity
MAAGMTVFGRYILLQVPGWILAAVAAYAIAHWAGLDWRIAAGLWLAYFTKDFVLYPFLRRAYETNAASGTAALIGESGTATEDLKPQGYVRVRGELWHAELVAGAPAVRAGTRVRVRAARGLTLTVTPE